MGIQRLISFLAFKWWRVLIITVVNSASFALLFSLEHRFQALTGQAVYDTQNNLDQAMLLEQLPLYDGPARDAYYLFAAYDFIFPAVAALFIAVVLTWLLQHNPTRLAKRLQDWKLPLLAFVVTAFDWLENISLITVIQYGASVPESWLNAAILFKRLKLATLSLSGATLLGILIFTVAANLHRFWHRRSQRTANYLNGENSMTKTMKAVGLKRYGKSDVLEELDLPIPEPADDEVLIRVAAVAVNPADWMFRNGQFRLFMMGKLPFIPGADVAGEVALVGKHVTHLKPGDRVYTMFSTMKGGGYAEYVVAKASHVAVAPRTISLAEAAAVPLTALTALQALRDRANLQPGNHVLIHAASGGVGTFAVQIAKAMGATHVTGVCSGANADLVYSIGADEVIDYTQTDLFQLDKQYDVIFATMWNHTFWQWRQLLRPAGVVVSVNPIAQNPLNTFLAQLRGQQRLRSLLVKPSKTDLDLIREWIEAGQIQTVIDREYPLAKAAEAQDYSESKRVRGKLILIVDEALAATSPEKSIASSPV